MSGIDREDVSVAWQRRARDKARVENAAVVYALVAVAWALLHLAERVSALVQLSVWRAEADYDKYAVPRDVSGERELPR